MAVRKLSTERKLNRCQVKEGHEATNAETSNTSVDENQVSLHGDTRREGFQLRYALLLR